MRVKHVSTLVQYYFGTDSTSMVLITFCGVDSIETLFAISHQRRERGGSDPHIAHAGPSLAPGAAANQQL